MNSYAKLQVSQKFQDLIPYNSSTYVKLFQNEGKWGSSFSYYLVSAVCVVIMCLVIIFAQFLFKNVVDTSYGCSVKCDRG